MRYQNWPHRLNQIITQRSAMPFSWGTNDCCIFAADVVKELTGVDHAADLRGTYQTAQQAVGILSERGGVDGIATTSLGSPINPLMAQRGDVMLIDTPEHGHTLAICCGDYCVAPGATGLQSRSITAVLSAWRVM